MKHIKLIKMMWVLPALLLAGACVSVQAQTTSGLWDASSPLPKVLFDKRNPCEGLYVDMSPTENPTGDFLARSAFGVMWILQGLCLDAANSPTSAQSAYINGKDMFMTAIEGLGWEREIERLRLQNRERMMAQMGPLLEQFLHKTSLSAARPEAKAFMREVVKFATEQELSDVRMSLKSANFNRPTAFTSTIRIPLIPVGGFLKSIVKVLAPSGSCTGSFVGPKIVLTNLHCVKPGMVVIRDHVVVREQYSVKTWWTFRGERGTLTPEESKGACLSAYCNDDWALIEINETRFDADDYLVVPMKTPNVPKVMVAGYSGDVSYGVHASLDLNCPVKQVGINFGYECSTYKGSSGSPIMSMYDQRLLVALNNAMQSRDDTANTRGNVFGVRVEKFAPKLYSLLGKSAPEWSASGQDARSFLVEARAMVEQKGKAPALPKWDN